MSTIPCELISWKRFYHLARKLAHKIREARYMPDLIVAIERGGYMPARILSDLLQITDMTGFKVEHYRSSNIRPKALIQYPFRGSIENRNVLLVDDVSDTGDTFDTAVAHLLEHGRPQDLRTAVLHHKTVSKFVPDFYAQKIIKWRWITYPWAVIEDLSVFFKQMDPPPTTEEEFGSRLAEGNGICVPKEILTEVFLQETK